MFRFVVGLFIYLSLAAPARAQSSQQERFAAALRVSVDSILEVAGFALPRGTPTTHFLIGRYKEQEHTQAVIVLLRCDEKKCLQQQVWIDHDVELTLRGLIDLRGKPLFLGTLPVVNLRPGRNDFVPLSGPGPDPLRWPALVLYTKWRETTTTASPHGTATGEHTRERLLILSLLPEDAQNPKLLHEDTADIYPTHGGMRTDFRLEPAPPNARPNAPLNLAASQTRQLDRFSECLPPKPFPVLYRFRDEQIPTGNAGQSATMRFRRYEREPNQPAAPIGCY